MSGTISSLALSEVIDPTSNTTHRKQRTKTTKKRVYIGVKRLDFEEDETPNGMFII
jgi:hypothetical protein